MPQFVSNSNLALAMQSQGSGAPGCSDAHDHPAVKVECSKCLPQCNEDLRCLDAWDRIQVTADIKSDRTHRRDVAKAHAERVGVSAVEVLGADVEYIAAVVEHRKRQVLFYRQGKPKLRVQNQKLR